MVKEIREDFVEFDVTAESHHLDAFYWKLMEDTCPFKNLVVVLKIILTLSHDQASVERGFSVSKFLLVENLATKSLIAQRIVYDNMKVNDVSAEDVEICQLFVVVSNMLDKDIAHIWNSRKRTKLKMIDLSNENKFNRNSQQ